MAEILKRTKPLAVNPLKASQPIGAALAFILYGGALGQWLLRTRAGLSVGKAHS